MYDASSEPILDVRSLQTVVATKAGLIRPVDGVSFSVRAGETLGIVGESGSGKSMTGLSLLRVVPQPAAEIVGGSVRLSGKELLTKTEHEMRAVRGRRISMILQDPQTSLNPVFTVGDQILEALRVHKRGTRRTLWAQVVEVLRKVRLAAPEERAHSYPHEMSGGMRQRVVGAIGISCEPQVLIADEPTTALDVTVQAQYLKLLKEIQDATGLAIIFITHDFGVVAKLCHRVLVMYAGRVVECGAVRDIFDRPSHPYTEALLHSVPRLERRIKRLASIEGQPPRLWDLPKGCRFAPRCPYADDRCWNEYPPEFPARGNGDGGHIASCWRLEDRGWKPTFYSMSGT